MAIIAIEELPARLAGGRTLAGLDLGDKTIGVAVSDRGLSFAHPRPVILRKKFSLDAGAACLLDSENVGAIARRPAGQHGRQRGTPGAESRAFVRNMARLTDLPFVLWDERLSTVAAERTLIEMDFSRKKRAGKIDWRRPPSFCRASLTGFSRSGAIRSERQPDYRSAFLTQAAMLRRRRNAQIAISRKLSKTQALATMPGMTRDRCPASGRRAGTRSHAADGSASHSRN